MSWIQQNRILKVIGVSLVLLAGCQSAPSDKKNEVAPVKVEVALPVERDVTDFRDFTGRMEAVDFVEIRPRVTGYLTKVAFDPKIEHAAEINAGDLLFEIDARPYENALQSAQAQLAGAEASLTTNRADLEREEDLFKKKINTKADLDRAVGAKLQSEASLLAGKAAVAQATLDLEFTKIIAPISGRISRKQFSIGDLITPSSGKMTSIVSVDPIYVYFDLDEPTLLTLQSHMREGKMKTANEVTFPVLVGLANDEGYPFQGKLDFVENQVDPETGTIRLRGVFTNPKPERGNRPLTPGLFARVRLPLGEAHKALLIPERAIGRDQGSPFVYVVGPDKEIVYRKVQLGALQEGLRVVTEGLSANDQIVVNGIQRIRPGTKVDPQPVRQADVK